MTNELILKKANRCSIMHWYQNSSIFEFCPIADLFLQNPTIRSDVYRHFRKTSLYPRVCSLAIILEWITVKVFFLQPSYFSYSQGIFLKAKVFFLYPRYFSFHCTFTSLGRFVSLTAAGPRRSHRSRTEGWPAIVHSCDSDMPSSLQMKKLNF